MAFNLRDRSFVKLLDFTPAEIKFMLKLSADLKAAKYGGFEQQRLKGKNIVTAMLLVGIINYMLVVFRPSWITIGWWNVWNAFILVVAKFQSNRLQASSAP